VGVARGELRAQGLAGERAAGGGKVGERELERRERRRVEEQEVYTKIFNLLRALYRTVNYISYMLYIEL
jgi:hypothetical protein